MHNGVRISGASASQHNNNITVRQSSRQIVLAGTCSLPIVRQVSTVPVFAVQTKSEKYRKRYYLSKLTIHNPDMTLCSTYSILDS